MKDRLEPRPGPRPQPHDLDELTARVRDRDGPLRISGLRGTARAAAVAHFVRSQGPRPVVILVPHAKAADAFAEDLRATLGESPWGRVRPFPRHDSQPYERFSPQPFIVAQRMDVLYRWLRSDDTGGADSEPAPVVIAPWTALALRVPSPESVRARSVHLEVGQTIDRDALVDVLVAGGYSRGPLVEERGELAVRGGILDFFPPQAEHPIRIELIGDEVESIRSFDPGDQRSEGTLAHAVAPPPRELLVERSLVIENSAAIRELAARQQIPNRNVDELLEGLLRGYVPPGAESLAPLLSRPLANPLDYLPADTLWIVDDEETGRSRLEQYVAEAFDNFTVARDSGRVVAPPDQLLVPLDDLFARVRAQRPVWIDRLEIFDGDEADRGVDQCELRAGDHEELRRELIGARSSDRALAPLVERIDQWREQRWSTVLTTASLSGAERLRALLEGYGVKARTATEPRPVWRWSGPGRVEIRPVSLSAGTLLSSDGLSIVTEEEIFGPRERRRRRSRWPQGAAVEALSQLAPGGYLVHSEHGIGIYRGLTELELNSGHNEFLRLEYAEGDRLFLPIDRLDRIQVYTGSDGHVPRIDKLGGATWEKAKRDVKKSLRDMAHQLLSVHAARELAPGYAFPPRDRLFEEFEASFPFEETPDQLSAIEDVLSDMQREKPMDRVVCGDVGYGKTEVAVRAAFQAAMNGRQVAILVPTTILCQQHEETFRERLGDYPVRIEALSRFQSPRKSKQVLEGLADGSIDIVIGTHRLLQGKVRFRDLGLLVVDEEHRFGVAHKERIKQLKKTLDVLTLTATPIPRTLQLALTGIRDLSVIDTAPADRLAIRTQVCPFQESLIREVILREVRRGGQVFFVHNRVRSIGAMAELLKRLVPEVETVVAHGQMREQVLEEKMLSFMRGEGDVLLSTTIIESGLDIPRANTIVIDRADRLGLAQLYQLRGRVGRSHQRAYAYLLIPGRGALTDDAEKRLDAIRNLTELGSGFRLASMDLEIRGAGNLLGAEQSGNLSAVGYETYMEMLETTIDELKGKPSVQEIDPEIRLPVAARLPAGYVSSTNQRLVLYKRLSSCRDPSEVDRVRDEILDRFGPLPVEASNLISVIRLKIRARELGIAAIDVRSRELVLTAGQVTQIDPQRLMALVTQASPGGGGVRVTPEHKIYAPAPSLGSDALFETAHKLLSDLAN
ncbi:transcription-repair coupling factor [Myxococcota bacterium]|nr:transcription-repair coupling factor [Myxococcota bacterium]